MIFFLSVLRAEVIHWHFFKQIYKKKKHTTKKMIIQQTISGQLDDTQRYKAKKSRKFVDNFSFGSYRGCRK